MNVSTPSAPLRRGSLLRTVKAVAASFVGVRKNSEYEQDVTKLHPFHVIAVALVGVAMFVAALVLIVNWVVAK